MKPVRLYLVYTCSFYNAILPGQLLGLGEVVVWFGFHGNSVIVLRTWGPASSRNFSIMAAKKGKWDRAGVREKKIFTDGDIER